MSPRGIRGALPLAAGVALLADLGTGGERTDLGAHAFGFILGIAVSAGLLVAEPRFPKGDGAQLAYGASALSLLALAWMLAVVRL